jgi:hydroxyacylglutathione hydrolase
MPLEIHVLPVTPFQQNCSIIVDQDSRKALLIDAGGEVNRIQATLQELDATLGALWLTHGHLDHAGGAKVLSDSSGIEVIGPHEDDQFWLDQMEVQAGTFGLESTGSFKPHRYLQDGDELEFEGHTFKVLHCPGHTPGQVVFFQPDQNFLIAGDVIFLGSIGRTDFPRSNHADLIHAIRTKVFALPDDCTIYPGHGPTTTVGQEKATNPYVGTMGR